jgi:hypothetical protein
MREGGPNYQAVRNVAAALALAGQGQQAVFALIYDQENPYFGGYGDWPGWPAALHATLDHAHPGLSFRSVSWQELTPLLPSDGAVYAGRPKSTGYTGPEPTRELHRL